MKQLVLIVTRFLQLSDSTQDVTKHSDAINILQFRTALLMNNHCVANCYYYMVDEQMKVPRSLNNTSYLVTGLFD